MTPQTLLSFFLQTGPQLRKIPNALTRFINDIEQTKEPPNSVTGEPMVASQNLRCVLQETASNINIIGINDNELTGVKIVTTAVVLQTN